MRYRFDEFELDTEAFDLRRDGATVRVEPQVFGVLACLVAERARLVSRAELLDRVWGHRFVSDATVASRIKAARQAIGDDGNAQRLIRTVTGHGYRFVGEVREVGRSAADSVASHRTLVGRERQLASLVEALDEARTGAGAFVVVEGPGGGGKTSIVDAFLHGPAAWTTVLRGQCVRTDAGGEAFGPFLEVLGQALTDPSVAQRLTHVAPGWMAQLPAPLGLDLGESAVTGALGVTRPRLARELAGALQELAADPPLLVVIEDLHWADDASLELVEALGRRPPVSGVLIVATLRNAGRSTRATALASELAARGRARLVEVGPLSPQEIGAYLDARCDAGRHPEWLPRLLEERTGGNPLFVRCLVDAWLRSGQLGVGAGGDLAADHASLVADVPESARRLVTALLRELPVSERELVEVASVAGVTFSAIEVSAGLGVDLPEADDRLAALAEAGSVIVATGPTTWPDGTRCGGYAFVHELHRDTVVESLSPARAAAFHLAVGDGLERAYADTTRFHAARLARHFLEGGDDARGVRYLRTAAGQSLALSAHAEAAAQAQEALQVLERTAGPPDPSLEIGLRSVLAAAGVALHGWAHPGIEAEFARACELAQRGAQGELPPLVYGLATLHEYRGEYERSAALMEEHLARGVDVLLPEALELLACSTFHQGGFARSLAFAERALEELDPFVTSEHLARFGECPAVGYHCWAALDLWYLGREEESLAHLERAFDVAETHVYSLTTAQAQAAFLHQHRGDVPETLRWAETTIDVASAHGFPFRVAQATILRGWAVAASGDPRGGLVALERGLDLYRATGAGMDVPYYLGIAAETLARCGLEEDALASLDEAQAALPERGFFYAAPLLRLEALLRGRDDPGAAGALLESALAIAHDQGAAALVSELETLLRLARAGTPACFTSAGGA